MDFTFNGNRPTNMNFNGLPVNELKFNGTTVWVAHSLPSNSFLLNINAKRYDSNTGIFSNEIDATYNEVLQMSTPATTMGQDYVYVDGSVNYIMKTASNAQSNPFNINSSRPDFTVVFKVGITAISDGEASIFANRGYAWGFNWNWIVRQSPTMTFFHYGGNNYQGPEISLTNKTAPLICACVISGTNATYYLKGANDSTWTIQTNNQANFGNQADTMVFFAEKQTSIAHPFIGNFYYAYMAPVALSLSDIEQVIDYNENYTTN